MRLPVKPMLAQASAAPDGDHFPPRFDREEGIAFEVKWDGYRAIAVYDGKQPTLWSRPGQNISAQFPEIINTMPTKTPFVADGELVMSDGGLRHSFQGIQNHRSGDRHNLRFMAFDLLEVNGDDIQHMSWEVRRQYLYDVVALAGVPWVSSLPGPGRSLWQTVLDHGLEGLISKPMNSRYVQGNRGIWQKHKRNVKQVFEVVGYTTGEGSRSGAFGALILGEERSDQLRYAGKCGTGFDRHTIAEVLQAVTPTRFSRLGPGEQAKVRLALHGRSVTWLDAGVKVLVEFNDWSDDRIVRMGAFKGLVA